MTETLTDSLQRVFGFDQFRSGQAAALESLEDGQDTLAILPTGAGASSEMSSMAARAGELGVLVVVHESEKGKGEKVAGRTAVS